MKKILMIALVLLIAVAIAAPAMAAGRTTSISVFSYNPYSQTVTANIKGDFWTWGVASQADQGWIHYVPYNIFSLDYRQMQFVDICRLDKHDNLPCDRMRTNLKARFSSKTARKFWVAPNSYFLPVAYACSEGYGCDDFWFAIDPQQMSSRLVLKNVVLRHRAEDDIDGSWGLYTVTYKKNYNGRKCISPKNHPFEEGRFDLAIKFLNDRLCQKW